MEAVGGKHEPASAAGAPGTIRPSIWNALPHYLPFLVFPLLIAAAVFGGWWIAGPVVLLLLVNIADSALGRKYAGMGLRNMDPGKARESRFIPHRVSVWAWAVLYPPVLLFTLWSILAAGHPSLWELLLLAVALGCSAQMAYSVGHELIHSHSTFERRVGELLLSSFSFAQSATEHIYAHHALAGTPADAVSAPRGMSFWQFLPRAVASSLTESWRIERNRLARRRLPARHYTNPFWRYGLLTAAWYAAAYWMNGAWGLLILFLASAIGIVLVRLVDYIQHYGLQRIQLPDGRFESVQAHHAWSAASRIRNWIYCNQQRHPDHHVWPTRRFPLLQHRGEDSAPQLPKPYASMCLLALFPRRWFRLMDPEVEAWRKRFYPLVGDWSAYDCRAFAARPSAHQTIAEILGTSPRLGRWVNDIPELLDNLESREFTDLDLPEGFGPDPEFESVARQGLTRLYWTREFDAGEMKQRVSECPAQGAHEAAEVARNLANDKAFQVEIHMLRGNLTPREARVALSNIAEGSIAALLSRIEEELASWRAPSGEAGIAVALPVDPAVGQSALGGRLDLFCAFLGSPEYFTELAHRFFDALREYSRGNLLFAPIADEQRMRPPLPINSFPEHFQRAGAADDLLELARARCIHTSGSDDTARSFETARRDALCRGAAREALISRLCGAPWGENGAGLQSIENMRGGIRDIERAARLLQLILARESTETPTSDEASLFKAAAEHGVIPSEAAEGLAEAAERWQSLAETLRMIAPETFDIASASPEARNVIARSCGLRNFEDLDAAIRDSASRAAAGLEAVRQLCPAPAEPVDMQPTSAR